MIDWLNFIIGIVFAFAGISIIVYTVKHYLTLSLNKYLFIALIGVVFLVAGSGLILNPQIEFNPDLHECLETKYDYYFMTNEEAEQTYDEGRCDNVKTARYNGVLCRSEECISFHEKKQVVSDD